VTARVSAHSRRLISDAWRSTHRALNDEVLGIQVFTAKSNGSWGKGDYQIVAFAHDRLLAGERVALVTLVKIEGSSPRPLGAQMAVTESGEWLGYLSGGCIEQAVVAEAIAAIQEGENRRVRYGNGSKYIDIVLPCGSAIELFFDVQVRGHDLARIVRGLGKRRSVSLPVPCKGASPSLIRDFEPTRRLVVLGVGPSAVGLARIGAQSGFETTLYSPDDMTREGAGIDGIATCRLTRTANPGYRADRRTAIVFMFHDHEWEHQLIPAALMSDAFYIGALGSSRTHRQRAEQLRRLGFQDDDIARIHGPAGIFPGGKCVEDIAVSILAEIIQIDLIAPSPRVTPAERHRRHRSSDYAVELVDV